MPSEYWDRLSDIEIQRKLIQFGYPHCPVTETTRAVLIKKLQKHTRQEELKKGKIPNYVLQYNNDKQSTDALPPTGLIERRPNLHENGIRNNRIDISRNSAMYRKSDVDALQMPTPRMYVSPPLLASDYEIENDPHNMNGVRKPYRKPLPYHPPDNTHTSYLKLHGKANSACDGGVVNRLLSFRDTSLQKKPIPKDGGYLTHGSRSLIKNGIVQKILAFDVRSFLRKPDVTQYIIPHVLIAILVIFLAMISVLYMAKKFDLSPITETDIKYTVCNANDVDLRGLSSSSSTSQQTIKCISEDLFNKAIYISKELFKYLNERARLHHCISADYSAALDINEFKKALSSNSKIQMNGNLQTKLLATQYLIAQNPQWMIKTITSTHNSSDQILSFELIEPSLPLKCVILKKVTRFFTVIGLLILVASGCLAIYFLFAVYRLKQKESLQATEQFTKDIINELMYRSTQPENSEVIINQLQDKFLPPHNRKKLLGAWNKALKNLESNDNRILFGMIVRNGEQLRTMTWNKNLGNSEPSTTTKKWQSSAFDNSNKILSPPTSCLKIRHMFDASEINDPNLRQLMIESIYEKVGSNCNICDVQLDTQSCCVYIRCATEADAGIVHNEINGWWFDKRLISIKFLRLERYLNRFPKSMSESLFLKSSNVN